MTVRKRETEIRNQLSRKLRAISSCNQELLRADDEQALLDKICWIICEEAGYLMAWVGYAEHDEARTVKPRAWAGAEHGFLSQQGITWSDSSEGHRPLGLAIRSGKPVYVQDLSSGDESATWSAHALSRGFHSTIALPLKDEEANTFGVLCIYSGQTQAFTPDEIELLQELAADLAFGITSLRLRAERIETELRLVASEQVFRTLVENSPDYVARYDQKLQRIYLNPALQKLFNRPVAEMLGTTTAESSPISDPEHYMECIRRVIDSGREVTAELSFRSLEGDTRWANIRFAPEFAPDGKVVSVLAISRDITERKQAEEERQAHLYFLESLDRINRILQGEGNLDQIMNHALDAVLDIFDCDRAYLVYPCDPNSATWSVPIESTRPEFPGAGQQGPLPMNKHVAFVMQTLLESDHPIQLGPDAEFPVPEILLQQFNIRSNMAMILHPRVDKPWQFGLHQCSRNRIWSDQEVRLFEEIGRRLSDGLNNLLIARDLRESEGRFRLVFENSPLPIREEDFSAVKRRLEELRPEFGDDIEGYLTKHPEIVNECASLVRIVDVNRTAMTFHAADSKERLMSELPLIFVPETFETRRGTRPKPQLSQRRPA
ncbi:MAG: GAF domain-containing protein [Gammaproteobacteria bacterium]